MYCLLNILYCFYFSLFFFQQPLSSLGRPRILVGLLYSSSQEIEVDARHYKQNTSNQSSQGFLHIHLFRGRDLPQGKPGSTETFSKWYATRKPFADTVFFIVLVSLWVSSWPNRGGKNQWWNVGCFLRHPSLKNKSQVILQFTSL